MSQINYKRKKFSHFILAMIGLIFFNSAVVYAQGYPFPPRPIQVTKTVDLAFGAFYLGISGGTVAVSAAGGRTSSGDVVLLGMSYPVAPAVFRVRGNPGTLVTPMLGGPVTLNGVPAGSMILTLNPTTNPLSPFVLPGPLPANAIVDLNVGGTLTVGGPGTNPPGSYGGTFTIIFNQN